MTPSHNTILANRLTVILAILSCLLVGGCATTQSTTTQGTTTQETSERNIDPIEPTNRVIYSINETIDEMFIKPVAGTYAYVTPDPARQSISNFFNNLGYLNVILNSFLQGKGAQGWSDTSRFLINSTLGIGGLFDVADDLGFPSHDEDLGQTLAVWGVDQGAYLYLPIVGPRTARHTPDVASSTLTNPLFYVTSSILYPIAALGVVSKRAELLEATRMRDEAALDAYLFTREAYLQRRNYLIHDGNPPATGYTDIFDMENGEPPAPE